MARHDVAIKVYTRRSFRAVLIILPSVALISALFFTIGFFAGWYPETSVAGLVAFDLSTVLYLCLSIFYRKTSYNADGELIPSKLKSGKLLMVILVGVHWNACSYIFPSVDFWAFAPLFLLLIAVMLDSRMVLVAAFILLVSIFASWSLCGASLLPPHDALFPASMALRVMCLILSMAAVVLLTWLCNTLMARELEFAADFDPLTKLMNRRQLAVILEEAAKDEAQPYSVAMLDLDLFKQVNDRYGHDFGDKVLVGVSEILKSNVRETDTVFRWGGEEILVLFACNSQVAADACERILKHVAEHAFVTATGEEVHITLTAGVADLPYGGNVDEALKLADTRMYYGKQHGRAQVVRSVPPTN